MRKNQENAWNEAIMKKAALKKIGFYNEYRATEEHLKMLHSCFGEKEVTIDPKCFKFVTSEYDKSKFHDQLIG